MGRRSVMRVGGVENQPRPRHDRANQREQASGRGPVHGHGRLEALAQGLGAFVVQRTAANVDGLDSRPRSAPDGIAMAVSNGDIIADKAAKRPHGRRLADEPASRRAAHLDVETTIGDSKVNAERTGVVADGGEAIVRA